MAHETVIRSSLLVRDVQNPNIAAQKFAVFTGSGNNDLNLLGFRTPTELLSDIGFNEAVDDRVSTLIQAGANISVTYDDDGNALIIAAPNTVTGSGTATQIAFWDGTTGSTSTSLSGSSNLYWDNVNGRLGVGTANPSARFHVRSTGTTSSTTALLVQNGAATPANLLTVLDNGQVGIRNASPSADLHVSTGQGGSLFIGGGSAGHEFRINTFSFTNDVIGTAGRLYFAHSNNPIMSFPQGGASGIIIYPTSTTQTTLSGVLISTGRTITNGNIFSVETNRGITGAGVTSSAFNFVGARNLDPTNNIIGSVYNDLYFGGIFSPSTATNNISYNGIQFEPTIDQRNGTNAPVRGILINPTITSSPNFRSVEWTNISGFGLYGSGTAPNYINGNLLLGNLLNNARLQVHGADTTDTGWTAQFHNSLGNSNSLMIRNDGNVGIGTSGTTARLVVRGSGSSAASNALIVQNSGGTSSFVVQDDGIVRFNTARVISGFMTLQTNGGSNLTGFSFTSVNPFTATSDITSYISGNPRYWPVSGTGTFTYLNVNPSIDQTGGANGITRGIYIQPSLISAPNWRSIEWNNDSGFGLYGAGSGTNYLNGNLGIKTTTPAQTLHVAGTMRLTGNAGTATEALGRDANGDLSGVPFSTIVASGGGVSGSGTAGQVTFWTGANSQGGDNGLFWNNTNKRLGIGTTTPSQALHILDGSILLSEGFPIRFGSSNLLNGNTQGLDITNSSFVVRTRFTNTGNLLIGNTTGAARLHVVGSSTGTTAWTAQFHNSGGTSNSLMIRDDGNVAIGNSSPSARLQVHGADTSDSNWTAQFHNVNGNNNSLMIRNDGRVSFGTASPSKPFHVSGEAYFASALQLEGGLKDNRDNVFLSQSLNSVTSNRDIILGNGTYARIRLHSKEVSIGASFPTTNYLFYVDGGTGTGITDRQGIYMRPTQPAVGGNTNGGDVIIELPNGTGTGRKGTVLIGASATTINSALLELVSTDRGFLPPRMTSVERDAIATPATGLQIYNTTLNVMQHYNGTTWVSEAGGGGTGTVSGSGTATQVAFWGGTTGSTSTALSGSSNLYWDGINNRLGIGTSTPTARLEISGSDALINNRIVGLGVGNTSTNTFLSTGVGSNFSGGHTVAIGAISLPSITTASANVLIGSNAGNNITTGGSNTYIGRDAGSANQTAIVNFGLGTFALLNHTTGDNNIAIGFDAGRRISTGATMTSSSNGIFIGNDTKPLANGNTNQIIIGQNSVGLGSNTTVIGNTGTTQTHLHGNLTLGSTSSPTARMVVVGSGSSNTGWTAQFHNVLGNSNSLMIRDDGNVGFGTDAPTGKIDARSDSGIIAFFGVANGGTRLSVNSNGRVGLGLVGWIPTTDGGQNITTGAGGCFIGYDASGDLAYTNVASVTLGRPLNRLLNATTNTQRMVDIVGNFSPTSGNATFYDLGVIPTINQTGGASGTTRGLFVNPLLTSAADWRSIEWTNNTGWGIYGSGTAKSYFAGNVAIGTTTQNASSILELSSTTQGFLPPRMSTANRNLISSPATGLQVYNSSLNVMQHYNGVSWVNEANPILTRVSTGTTQVELFLDGVSSRFGLVGTNKVWNFRIQLCAIVASAGTGTLDIADSYISEHLIGIKRSGSSINVVGGGVVQNLIGANTQMEDSVVTITGDSGTESLRVFYTPPSGAAANTVIRISATLYYTEAGV